MDPDYPNRHLFLKDCQEWRVKYIHIHPLEFPDLYQEGEDPSMTNFLLDNFSDIEFYYCILSFEGFSEEQVIRHFNRCYGPYLMAISATQRNTVPTEKSKNPTIKNV